MERTLEKTEYRKIVLPEAVSEILQRLADAGFEAYAVGGCVRDSLLGKEPEDWDITTSASPENVKRLFSRTVDTGIEHGTVTVLYRQKGYEVTTYRLDGAYEDHRHPKSVTFTGELAEDLRRRDFTINAMAYSEREGLIDLFGGQEDLRQGVIRCVGKPMERFFEDALRILRAVRFCAQLDFSVEEETLCAMKALAGDLRLVSVERVRTELTKLLLSGRPDRLLLMQETGISAIVLPEWDRLLQGRRGEKYRCENAAHQTLQALFALYDVPFYKAAEKKERQILVYTVLLHDCAEHVGAVLRRMKFDNETIGAVTKLVCCYEKHTTIGKDEAYALRLLASRIGTAWMPFLFAVWRAEIATYKPEEASLAFSSLSWHEALFLEIVKRGECVCLKQLAVNGKDLLALGYAPGKQLGGALSALLSVVLHKPEKNRRDTLLLLAERYLEAGEIPENPME